MPHFYQSGCTLYYETHGSRGEAVLLIQGVGAGGGAWLPQVEHLSRTCRTAIFDNRGFGRSSLDPGVQSGRLTVEQMAADSAALLRHLGWSSAHVVGHSMGGVIAQQLALNHPEMVQSITLLCTVPRGSDAVRLTPRLLAAGVRTRLGTRASRRRAFLELIYPPELLEGQDLAALAERLAPLFGRDLADNPPIILQQVSALKRHDCTDALGQLVGIPALVISAEHDPIAPPRFGRILAELLPESRFVEIAGASHGVTISHAEVVNDLLLRFMSAGDLAAKA